MNKFFNLILILIVLVMFAGCSFFSKNESNFYPYNLTTADQGHFETIGMDFLVYYTGDDSIDRETKNFYEETLRNWQKFGSDWSTYKVIKNPYTKYFTSDPSLTDADKKSRQINVLSWELNIEVRKGVQEESNKGVE